MRSSSIITALRDEVPSSAMGPDRMVGMPIFMVLACARATQGAARKLAAPPAKTVRRVTELH